uniref:MMS19 nucleotide excision repair protein n=2 Tax=Tetraselmis sp. GSL018 TaxID=582737 RepID=A0A061RYN5_9CHLO
MAAARATAAALRADSAAVVPALDDVLRSCLDALERASPPLGGKDATAAAAALMRLLSAAVEVCGGWNWSGGWECMAASGDAAEPEAAQARVVSALRRMGSSAIARSLESPAVADEVPDLSMAVCAVDVSFARFCVPALPQRLAAEAAPEMIGGALRRAAACCACNHKGAALAGLTSCSAFIKLGDSSSEAARGAVLSHGMVVAWGLLGTLLGPSPLSRVHKVASVLGELVSLVAAAVGSPDSAASTVRSWLSDAMDSVPRCRLLPGERSAALEEWGPLLAAIALVSLRRPCPDTGADGDGRNVQRLKRALRAFVERR